MPNLALGKPVENAADINESRVLAVIDHLAPILADWRKGGDLTSEAAAIDQGIAKSRAELAAAQRELGSVAEELESLQSAATKWSFGGIAASVVALLAWQFAGTWAALVLVLIAGGLYWQAIAKKSETKAFDAKSVPIEQRIAELDTSLKQAVARRTVITAEVASRGNSFPEVRLADVRFGLTSSSIAGHNVLLDASGSYEPTKLKTVDVSALAAGLADISGDLNALKDIPPLLSPDRREAEGNPIYQLFGEESRLHDLVSDFTVNLGKLRDVELGLPLIPRDSALVRRLEAGELTVASEKPVIAVLEPGESQKALDSFGAEVGRSKEQGLAVFEELRGVFGGLENACRSYANARTTSVNVIHQNLLEVLNRATWCSRRFYCPRSIVSPKYLEDLLAIDIDRAYVLSLDDLIERLRSDTEITKRLDAKPELEEQLTDSYYSVQEFLGGVAFDDEGKLVYDESMPRHMRNQFEESVKRLTNVLRKVMTGTTYPVLNFSPSAQLFYDPESEEWSSDVSPHVYTTGDALRYGGVVKAYSDLMMPLWERLWTEKADFRKSELFRTNESMIRMSEKESEKLIEIANQFRADMRTVRENTYLIEADLRSKFSEITNFRDGMDRLGLLSDRVKANISDENLSTVILGDSSMVTADRYETLLGTMPQSQAENRGTVQDPIDVIREPDALIRLRIPSSARLLTF
jgi:hypothetical protein